LTASFCGNAAISHIRKQKLWRRVAEEEQSTKPRFR
jgi:hypothetical protein